jgi:hypothetical protein
MVTQRDVLAFIAKRGAKGLSVTARALADELWLSPDLAGRHLSRLWRERLIETVLPRTRGSRFRLDPGETISAISFRLAPRGRQRLRWYGDRQNEDGHSTGDLFGLFR